MLMPVFAMAIGPWEVFEASFKSSKEYDNPYVDVEVDVLFSNGKREWKAPAFWDGGKTWKVRFSAPEKGKYSYRAVATDKSNEGLNTKEKTLKVTEFKGDNPLYKHGPIRVSENRRYFEHADGTRGEAEHGPAQVGVGLVAPRE